LGSETSIINKIYIKSTAKEKRREKMNRQGSVEKQGVDKSINDVSLRKEALKKLKKKLERELSDITDYVPNEKWKSRQSALMDRITNEVYQKNSVSEVLSLYEEILQKLSKKRRLVVKEGAKEKIYHIIQGETDGVYLWNEETKGEKREGKIEAKEIKDYIFRRYFNYKTSKMAEEVFLLFDCCGEVSNKKDKEKDLYIHGIPFDVKFSSKSNLNNFSHLEKQEDKNKLIQWLYENQSHCRTHYKNRIFLVVGDNYEKMNVERIFERVSEYIEKLTERRRFNRVEIRRKNGGKEIVKSDIIIAA
jgi:hypothetical protein